MSPLNLHTRWMEEKGGDTLNRGCLILQNIFSHLNSVMGKNGFRKSTNWNQSFSFKLMFSILTNRDSIILQLNSSEVARFSLFLSSSSKLFSWVTTECFQMSLHGETSHNVCDVLFGFNKMWSICSSWLSLLYTGNRLVRRLSVLDSMNILTELIVMYCDTSYNKCTYCKSLWIKASDKCPKCKCKCKRKAEQC